MATEETIPTYPFDGSGQLASNKVVERHVVSAGNDDEFAIIIPRCAPFFNHSLVVKDINTEEILTYGKDYYIGGIFEGITKYLDRQLPVSSNIVFIDQRIGGNFEITYQTIGGDFILDEQAVIDLYANMRLNPLLVRWEDVINKPITYPADPHPHLPEELGSYSDMINELQRVCTSLELLLTQEQDSLPSYQQLLIGLINQGKVLNSLASRITDVQSELTETVGVKVNQVILDLSKAKANLDATLAKATAASESGIQGISDKVDKAVAELETKINNVTDEVNGSINTAITNLNTTVANNYTEVSGKLKELEEKINSDVSNQLAAINKTISSNKTTTDKAIVDLTAAYKLADTNLTNTLTTKINTDVAAAKNAALADSAKRVLLAGDTMTGTLVTPKVDTTDVTNTKSSALNISSNNKDINFYSGLNKTTSQLKMTINSDSTIIRNQLQVTNSFILMGTEDYMYKANSGSYKGYHFYEDTAKTNISTSTVGNALVYAGDFRTDNGTSLEAIASTVTNLSSTVTTSLNNKVSKTGDTMTGILDMNNSMIRLKKELSSKANWIGIQVFDTSKTNRYVEFGNRWISTDDVSGNYAYIWNKGDVVQVFTNRVDLRSLTRVYDRIECRDMLNIYPDSESTFNASSTNILTIDNSNDHAFIKWTGSSSYLKFNSENAIRNYGNFRINDGGLGIEAGGYGVYFDNHSNGNAKFYINGKWGGHTGFQIITSDGSHTNGVDFISHGHYMRLYRNDNTGLWQFNQSISAVDLMLTSDKRHKRNLVQIKDAVYKLNMVRGYTYEINDPIRQEDGSSTDNYRISAGVVAQDLDNVLPEAVNKGDPNRYTVNYNGVSALLVEAVKELSEKVRHLQDEVNTLKAKQDSWLVKLYKIFKAWIKAKFVKS